MAIPSKDKTAEAVDGERIRMTESARAADAIQ
jgi:hypothetical protein